MPYEDSSAETVEGKQVRHQAPRRRLGLLEINIGGVTLRPLIDRLNRSSSSRIAIRQLVGPPVPRGRQEGALTNVLEKAAQSLLDMKYNESSLALSNSMLLSHLSHGRHHGFGFSLCD